MTAKAITWLGEDVEHEDGGVTPGPSFNVWGSIRFDKDKPVLIDDEKGDPEFRQLEMHILAVAPTNRFYKIEEVGDQKKAKQAEPMPVRHPPKVAQRR